MGAPVFRGIIGASSASCGGGAGPSCRSESARLSVWLSDEVLAIFRFYSADAIDFDVNLRELQGQERLDLFCEFLTAIGRRLGKPVLMDAEGGDSAHPVLGFVVEHDRVVRLAGPFAR